jgi:hypothetical protein
MTMGFAGGVGAGVSDCSIGRNGGEDRADWTTRQTGGRRVVVRLLQITGPAPENKPSRGFRAEATGSGRGQRPILSLAAGRLTLY